MHGLISAATLIPGLLSAVMAQAEAPLPQSRSPLGEAIRETLIDNPDLLARLRARNDKPDQPAAINIYSDDMAKDLNALAHAAPRLYDPALPGFGPTEAALKIALFTREGCAECARAMANLRILSTQFELRVTLIDMDDHADLAHDLGLDLAPSYVFGNMMLRGAMPTIVLKRSLSRPQAFIVP